MDPERPIEEARTPPAHWYTDPVVLQREREQVFRRAWQVVARTDMMALPGSYAAASIAGDPVVVVRGGEGSLRAFHNVCRHHAAELATGEGRVDELVCPYHGWTYTLEGRLRRAPRLGSGKAFDPASFGLIPLECATWGPWIFARMEGGGLALEATLSPLGVALDHEALMRLRHSKRRAYTLECNWKVFVDNYLDGGYHVQHLHGGLAAQLDLDSYAIRVHAREGVVLQTCRAAGRGSPSDPRGQDFEERLGDGAVYGWVHPNFMVNRYGPVLDTNLAVPLGPTRTLVVFDYWFDPELGPDPEAFKERCLAASHAVQLEDIAICESVQRGIASAGYRPGPYAPALEGGAYWFHRALRTALDTQGAP